MLKQQNVLVIFGFSPDIILKKPKLAVEYSIANFGFKIYNNHIPIRYSDYE